MLSFCFLDIIIHYMANNSNLISASEDSLNQMLADLHNFDFIRNFPVDLDLPFITSAPNPDLVRLKSKIDHFFQQYPNIVNEIRNHFYDEIIMYSIRCAFDPSFTINDVTQTQQLFNRFFNEHEENNKIIFDYFYNDLTPIILNSKFPRLKQFIQLIDLIPKLGPREFTICYLKKSGASLLTSLMYPNQMKNKNLSNQSTSHKNKPKYFLLLIFFIMLCITFGWEIFRVILYYFIGVICTLFALYLFVDF